MKLYDYTKTRVLFVCVHNSARSQIAEAFLNRLGNDEFFAESAGFTPAPLNPYAVKTMAELGYDLSKNTVDDVFEFIKEGRMYHVIVKVCDKASAQRCPIFPMTRVVLEWGLDDPADFTGTEEEILEKVRTLRDKIKLNVEQIIEEYKNKKLKY